MTNDRGTVLVVDDERSVRQLAANLLRRDGFATLEAADGPCALETARKAVNLTVLLTDVVLPGMNGAELARELRAEHPDVRVVYMSGFDEDEIQAMGIGEVGAAYLSKPFTPEVLTLVVEGALTG